MLRSGSCLLQDVDPWSPQGLELAFTYLITPDSSAKPGGLKFNI